MGKKVTLKANESVDEKSTDGPSTQDDANKDNELVKRLQKCPQLMPFKCSKTVQCDPATYFRPDDVTTAKDQTTLSAAVRGRPVRGSLVTLPEGFQISSCNYRSSTLPGGLESKSVEVKESFPELVVWNLSVPVDNTHEFKRALTWLKVSNCVHSDAE